MGTSEAGCSPLEISENEILDQKRFRARVVPTVEALWYAFSQDFADQIEANSRKSCRTTAILPVGPFDYRVTARLSERVAH